MSSSEKGMVVIHQPDFIPYLGFFHRLCYADTFVVFDNVQFARGSSRWQNRDKINTPNGEKWITVSVKKASRDTLINEIMLTNQEVWRRQHLEVIKQSYGKAPFFKEVFPYIEKIYEYKCDRLADFNWNSIQILMDLFDIECDVYFSSNLKASGKSNELIVNIVKEVGKSTYLSGIGAKDYFNPKPYEEAGVDIIWQNFKHPVYPQINGEFIPYLSSLDLLLNCGIDESRKVLKGLKI